MSTAPPVTHPEKFITGDGLYTNLRVVDVVVTPNEFRLEPWSLPTALWRNGLLSLVVLVIGLAMALLPEHVFNNRLLALIFVLIGTLTSLGLMAITMFMARRESKLGTLLAIDLRTCDVSLPREGVELASAQVDHFQYVTTKRPGGGNDRLSELNLVATVDGQRQRWTLLRSIISFNAFDDIASQLLRHTRVPIVRVKDTILGWDVTEVDMRTNINLT